MRFDLALDLLSNKRGRQEEEVSLSPLPSPPPVTERAAAIVVDPTTATSFLLTLRQSAAAKRIQRAVRSRLRFAYTKVYAIAFTTPNVGVPIDFISSIRFVCRFFLPAAQCFLWMNEPDHFTDSMI